MQDNHNQAKVPGVDVDHASDESLIRVHAQIRRTPIAASPIAFFTAVVLIIVFVFSWFYIRRYFAGGETSSYLADRQHIAALEAYIARPKEDQAPAAIDGGALYAQQCAACHQANGEGLAGAFPPLVGAEWVTEDPETPIKIVLGGLSGPITVKGQTYNGAMPAFGAVFDDAQVAAVVTYIRGAWENEASEVSAEQVAEVRAETGARGTWTAEELKASQ